jgi:Domain of unknown function (DUF1840)
MYKFKSRAAGNLIMLEPNGRQILAIIGKLDSATEGKGILLPEQMPAAIKALEAAVALDETRRAQLATQLAAQTADAGQNVASPEGIPLKLRALPFVEMIKRSYKSDDEIVWGV